MNGNNTLRRYQRRLKALIMLAAILGGGHVANIVQTFRTIPPRTQVKRYEEEINKLWKMINSSYKDIATLESRLAEEEEKMERAIGKRPTFDIDPLRLLDRDSLTGKPITPAERFKTQQEILRTWEQKAFTYSQQNRGIEYIKGELEAARYVRDLFLRSRDFHKLQKQAAENLRSVSFGRLKETGVGAAGGGAVALGALGAAAAKRRRETRTRLRRPGPR